MRAERFAVLMLIAISLITVNGFCQTGKPVVVQNFYYPEPGKEAEVYKLRLQASEVRAKLGLPKGRVLKKVDGLGGPYIIWECDYPTPAAREKDVQELSKSEEFQKVQDQMSTLLQKFERFIWEADN
jgi:hypothetical protein